MIVPIQLARPSQLWTAVTPLHPEEYGSQGPCQTLKRNCRHGVLYML